MKIVLLIPPRPYLFNQKSLPNLGILTVASVAKNLGCQVEILDLGCEKLINYEVDRDAIYGMYVTTPDYQVCLSILKYIKAHGAKVIAGGPHCSFAQREILEDGFDAVSIGDAEITLPQILEGNTSATGWLTNIDNAAHPDRTIIDLKKYNFAVDGEPATSMMTAKSCAWRKCVFCSRPINDILQYHGVPWVLEELNQITQLGFKAVQIYDDEFLTNPMRDMQIIRAMGERKLTWRCFGHSRFLLANKKLVEAASKNGLREILIGVESGSNRILGIINKGTTVEMNKKTIRMLHTLGIKVKCAMIIGLPSESILTLQETWEFCQEMYPYVDDWDFTVFTTYPGSKVFAHPEMFDIKFDKKEMYKAYKGAGSDNWSPPQISTKWLRNEQILQARDRLENMFKKKQPSIELDEKLKVKKMTIQKGRYGVMVRNSMGGESFMEFGK